MRLPALFTGLFTTACLAGVIASGATAAPRFELSMRSRTFTPDATTEPARDHLRTLSTGTGHLFLQMWNPEDRVERRLLEEAGVTFIQYLPEDTWIVSAPRDVFTRPATTLVRWAAPMIREDRLHPRLWNEPPRSWAITGDGHWRLYVRFFRDVEVSDARARLVELGAEVIDVLEAFRSFEIAGDARILEELAADDRVFWIRETAPPPVYDNDSNRANTHAGTVQLPPYDLDGTGVSVAIWDGGPVDGGHPDFAGRLSLADGTTPDWHATHVAGTVGGSGFNSANQGGQSLEWRGMAPGCDLVSFDWNFPLEEHNEAINTYGASVSQNSWSFGVDQSNCDDYGDYDFYASEYDEIIAGIYGGPMVICFSAGNERNNGDCGMSGPPYENYGNIPPPHCAKNMLTIGAVNSNDESMTNFSSWGPVDDGRIKPELVGPGCQIGDDGGVTSTTPGAGYGVACGTSMSCPTASGCVALLQQAYLDEYGRLPSASLVKAILINTARDLGRTGPDYAFGFGAIDVQAAVDEMQAGAFVEDEIDNGQQRLFEFEVFPGTNKLAVTLAWTDPPASAGSSATLINDLDLVLIGPDQVEHLPWDLTPGAPWSNAQRRANHRDPVEQVTVNNPLPGQWTARVTETGIPVGPQAFSLAGTTPQQTCAGEVFAVPSAEYPTIQAAIEVAGFCDTVLVAAGTYTEHLNLDQYVILKSIDGATATTIQAPVGTRAITLTSSPVIDGFTILDGIAFGSFPAGYGGGVFGWGVTPIIRNCVFRNCTAQSGGGAIFVFQGAPTIVNCEFDGNQSFGGGGAIGLEDSFGAVVQRNVIHHNSAGTTGGGVAVVGGSAELVGNTIANNTATGSSGGVAINSVASVLMDNNIVAGNSAPTSGGVSCSGTVAANCNDVWGNGTSTCVLDGPDNFSADPGFCDAVNGDYRILLTSPCAPGQSPGSCGLVGAVEPVESCGIIGVGDPVASAIPIRFAVYPAQPNPLTRSTRVRIDLPGEEPVRLDIFDVGGRKVRTVASETLPAGTYEMEWDGRDEAGRSVNAGVYFYDLRAGERHVTRKLVVLP